MGDGKAINLCCLGSIELDYSRFKALWCSNDDVAYFSNPSRWRYTTGSYQEAGPYKWIIFEQSIDCIFDEESGIIGALAIAGQDDVMRSDFAESTLCAGGFDCVMMVFVLQQQLRCLVVLF